jgi:hypothetical protein
LGINLPNETPFFIPSFSSSEPYTEYKIWVRAYTLKNEGKPSQPTIVRTDVVAPGPPVVVNLTCQNGHTMFLKWLRPTDFVRTVDVYHVLYRASGEANGGGGTATDLASPWERQVVETVNNTVNHMVSYKSREAMTFAVLYGVDQQSCK